MFGGNGYVETGMMARLFKEAPVNSIWEGSGNVMCLDVLRAIQRHPASLQTLFESFYDVTSQVPQLHNEVNQLLDVLKQSSEQLQFMARSFVSRLVKLAQAVLLKRYAPDQVANTFIQSRYSMFHGRVTGLILMPETDPDARIVQQILERSLPI